jgi:microcystin-dependent protein
MAQEIGNSGLLDTWASDGLKVTPTNEKIDQGWLEGEQPPHEYMNWLQNGFGQKLNHILLNGIPEWNATTAYLANQSVTKRAGVIYIAINNNTNSQPPSGNWRPIAPYPAKRSVAVDGNAYQLSGDVDTPAANYYYGTDGAGARGFHRLPDAAQGFDTGEIKLVYDSAERAGYVRLNGRTIGNGASAATERANADTEALFTFLWGKDSNLTVSGGRGASAAADFAAGKRLTLPDWRGRVPACVDGFGNSVTGRISASGTGNPGLDGSVLGAAGGVDRHALTTPQIPSHTHTVTSYNYADSVNRPGGDLNIADNDRSANSHIVTSNATGGNEAHPNLQPTTMAGYYIKL